MQSRQYHPAHNIGHFRYLECSHLTDEGRPAGDITVWEDIRFAFDPELHNLPDLGRLPVALLDPSLQIQAEESYACYADGTVKVSISNLSEGYSRSYRLAVARQVTNALCRGGRRKADSTSANREET